MRGRVFGAGGGKGGEGRGGRIGVATEVVRYFVSHEGQATSRPCTHSFFAGGLVTYLHERVYCCKLREHVNTSYDS